MKLLTLVTALLCAGATAPARAHDIIRHANPNVPVATSVLAKLAKELAAYGLTTVRVSGMIDRLVHGAVQQFNRAFRVRDNDSGFQIRARRLSSPGRTIDSRIGSHVWYDRSPTIVR